MTRTWGEHFGDNMMTTKRLGIYLIYGGLALALILGLAQIALAAGHGSIDPDQKYAWGTAIGWINFNPAQGGGTVYDDHLEGYAWAENVGWIRLGTHTGGGSHTYANTSADTYGVNNDGSGNLSGYAWGTHVGWIDFNPGDSQVTIDAATGAFDGYAWAENVGWIHFRHAGPDGYGVVTDWRHYVYYLPVILKGAAP